jgi:hypothetical protein
MNIAIGNVPCYYEKAVKEDKTPPGARCDMT